MMRRVALVAVGLCITVLPCWSVPVKVLVDGKEMPMSPPAMIRQGRVFIPVTAFRMIGLAVEVKNSREAWVGWPESDSIIDFKAGASAYKVGTPEGMKFMPLAGTPFMCRGALMVPIRTDLVGEDNQSGLMARWDSKARVLHIQRSWGFLRHRIESDAEYVRNSDWYSHIWLGNRVPIVPKFETARAEKLDRSGDWQGAVRILRRLIESRPFGWQPESHHTWDEWLAYGPLGLILTRQYPRKGEGYLYQGIGRAVKDDHSGAEEAFRQGIKAEPGNADLHFAAGWAVLRQETVQSSLGRKPETVQKALTEFDKALEIDPRHELSLRAAGYASLAMNDRAYLEKAAGYFERLHQISDPTGRIGKLLEEIHRQLGQP